MSPRTCPACAELNYPDRVICSECGAWLIEPKHRRLTELEFEDWKLVESVHRWTIVDDQRDREPDDPDQWMPHWKPRGDTAPVPGSIPPKEKP
jgi:hypothetical protein